MLVSFRGLGRKGGFEVAERFSVLGDEEYSPIVAERVCELCKTFMEKGVISEELVKKKLGIGETSEPDYIKAAKNFLAYENEKKLRSRLSFQMAEIARISAENTRLKEINKEQEKKLENNEKLGDVISSVFLNCDYEIEFDLNKTWYISVSFLHTLSYHKILEIVEGGDRGLISLIFHKIRPANPKTRHYFDFFKFISMIQTNSYEMHVVDWSIAGRYNIERIGD